MLVLALSVRSSIRAHIWLVVQAREIVGVNVSLKNDASSVATVTAVRPATWNEFLTAKAATAIAAIPSFRVNANVIDEFHSAIKPQERKGSKFRAPRPNATGHFFLSKDS